MVTRVNVVPRLLLIVMLVLGVLLSVAPGVGAVTKTDVPLSKRLEIGKQNCEDLNGSWTVVDGLSNGNEPLTIAECEYKDGSVLRCEHTPTTVDCWYPLYPGETDGDVADPDQADTLDPWDVDPTPTVTWPVLVPTTTPVANPRG
jgi:hypothetical protein